MLKIIAKKLNLNFYRNKISKWSRKYFVVIFISLFIFWIWLLFGYLKRTENANSVISIAPKYEVSSSNLNNQLYKNNKFSGSFWSSLPQLGIVAIRFNTYQRINADRLIFRIKERGSKVWYYENIYSTDQFQPEKLFTFGFPIIENSENKVYNFELESTGGGVGDAISVSSEKPIMVVKHKYLIGDLTTSKKELVDFISNKSITLIKDTDFVIHALLYLVLVISIFVFIVYTYAEPYKLFSTFLLTMLLLNIFYIKAVQDLIFITISVLWIIPSIYFGISTRLMAYLSITLFFISMVLYQTDNVSISGNAGAWFYMSLISLVVVMIIRNRRRKK